MKVQIALTWDEEIPGIGPGRSKALMKTFGSLKAIREADEEALRRAPGMTEAAARAVYAWAHSE